MVDDNPKNLQLLGNTLRNEGYQLEFATSGQLALSWFNKKVFDLVLLDIMMPEMSGFEVCEHVRKNSNLNDMPIIFLTAKTDKESIVHGFEVGGQDYITKPFDTSELLARVRTHIELRFNKLQLKNINKIQEEIIKERTRELVETNTKLIKANEDLISLDAAKSEFLHIISHEIRTPLNGIKGSMELIKELSRELNISHLLDILDISVTRLEKFTLMALKITQLKMKKYHLDFQPVPCELLISNIVLKLNNQIKQKSLTINSELPKGFIISGDFELLSTCFTSIIDNAIKFSVVNGKIDIKASQFDNVLEFEIKDEGPGFSEKAINSLFDVFSPGVKHVNENEGLELAMAKLIVENHNGTIVAYNSDSGAIVKIQLPFC
jgi:two-component system sensor histidine kinase/response regulator